MRCASETNQNVSLIAKELSTVVSRAFWEIDSYAKLGKKRVLAMLIGNLIYRACILTVRLPPLGLLFLYD